MKPSFFVRNRMNLRRTRYLPALVLVVIFMSCPPAPARDKYVCKVSNISTPKLVGVNVGFHIQKELKERTNGAIEWQYFTDNILGGEVDVLNKLLLGEIQGMLCSSVTVANLAPRMGILSLPFLIDSFEKRDKFVADKKLFQHMLDGVRDKRVIGIDVTDYGLYGWATKTPVHNLAEAGKIRFRIAEAPVSRDTYQALGIKPVILPWPEVASALDQNAITGLDHTPGVVLLSNMTESIKGFTRTNHAVGWFVLLINQQFYDSLPDKLKQVFTEVIHEQCAAARALGKSQEMDALNKMKAGGVEVIELAASERQKMRDLTKPVWDKWAPLVGRDYLEEIKKLVSD
ncbi:MAG: TRAP transporter substrate-binding protein [Deltaproteobacteria bacterium]|nr:TRAP transporter substrate-binding protein [Deltaproteobacteria bacterium]